MLVIDTSDKLRLQKSVDIPCKTISCSRDNRTVVVGGTDGVAYVLEAPDFRCVDEIELDARLIDSIDISSDGNLIVAVGFDRKVKVHDRRNGTTREFEDAISHFPNLVRLSPDETRVMTGSLDGVLRLWLVETGDLLQEWPNRPSSWPIGDFSLKGEIFLVGGINYAKALHAPRRINLKLLPASLLRSRACQRVSNVGW